MSGYHRLDGSQGYDHRGQQQQQQQQEQDYLTQTPQRYQYPTQSLQPGHHDTSYHSQIMTPPPPVASPGYHMRSPSPIEPLHQQGYELEDRPYHDDHTPLEIPMGPGPGGYLSPGDRMQVQPTYSIENMQNSFGHNEAYNEQHPFGSNAYVRRAPSHNQQHHGDYAINPEEHHDAYYNEPYQPGTHTPNDYDYENDQPHYWQDEPDDRPILHPDSAYGPDPHGVDPSPTLVDQPTNGYSDATPQKQPPTPNAQPIKRWKTVKEVQLYNGNLVLDCPIPPRLLNQITHAPPPERDEFTHMRYSAATCDPADFYNERFTLRQRLFAKPRHTELFIVVTMYNEEEELFARTMMGVIENIKYMNQRSRSKTWGKEAWKKIVVCVVSDGRAKINPRTRAVLAAMGCYQEGIAKQQVNGKDVTAHIYEYTTQMALEINKGVVSVKKGETPVQMLFCLKEKNQKKINSHRWFFQAFGQVLDPNICVLIDAGTRPGKDSIYQLWKAFDINPSCAGACGEIKAMIVHGKKLLNPLIAAQNFEYKISNILDKPLESVFGFISVLPGAFSAYRYVALQNDPSGQGPLEKYFAGEKMHGANAGVFTANMYLAEDRILCFELVAKKRCNWTLQYVKSATGETDVPEEMADFILQRRRWLNGSFFAAIYALAHSYQIFRSGHNPIRKFMFLFEFAYQTVNMIFAWFAIGNFFLVFRILTTSLGDPQLLGTVGRILAVVFEWLYLVTLVSCFVLSLGNRPQGSNKLYMTMVYFWVFIMCYLMFAAIFVVVKSIEAQVAAHTQFTVHLLFTNSLFTHLCVSMAATYALYLVMSILFFDPWHMFTSFVQYILLTPTYVNILNVYAFCNTHDITWGTKGDDKPAKLPTAVVKPSGGIDVALPTSDTDLNTQYEAELLSFSSKYQAPAKVPSPSEKQEDYYKGFRSTVVLVWMFCNLALAAAVLNTSGFQNLYVTKPTVSGETSADGEDQTVTTRSTIYMAVILWSVAGLAAVRFLGSTWFLILRFFRGV